MDRLIVSAKFKLQYIKTDEDKIFAAGIRDTRDSRHVVGRTSGMEHKSSTCHFECAQRSTRRGAAKGRMANLEKNTGRSESERTHHPSCKKQTALIRAGSARRTSRRALVHALRGLCFVARRAFVGCGPSRQ